MEQFISTPNSVLIQGATMSDLESMLSRLLDKKLADIIESTLKVDVSPKDRLYKRKAAAEKLQISLVTLDNWTKLGVINARKIGSRVYYTDSDINNALKNPLKNNLWESQTLTLPRRNSSLWASSPLLLTK